MSKKDLYVSFGAAVLTAALYFLTSPSGIPYGAELSLYLSIGLAALGSGLVGYLVSRLLGWRVGLSAALLWTTLPSIWYRAISGDKSILRILGAVVVIAALYYLTKRALNFFRKLMRKPPKIGSVNSRHQTRRRNRLISRIVLAVASFVALVALTLHDYRYGKIAEVFAKGIVEAAGERVIILNGAFDKQIVAEIEKRGKGEYVSLTNDEENREKLVEWAKANFPEEEKLWLGARVSPAAFVDLALENHKDKFYSMNGSDTTLEAWEKRVEEAMPYFKATDSAVKLVKRHLGFEGNQVANKLADEGKEAEAYKIYERIYGEVDSGNASALINMSELIRRGLKISIDEQRRVKEKLNTFLRDRNNQNRLREIVRAAGPVRADPELMAKMIEEANKRREEKIAAGEEERFEIPEEVKSLVEANGAMLKAMDRGDREAASRIARSILSKPEWRGFIPANAVMGEILAKEGDFAASERFYEVATSTTNRVGVMVYAGYANTLKELNKLDKAEEMARKAISDSNESYWPARAILAEILIRKGAESPESRSEIKKLLKSAMRKAPAEVRDQIRRDFGTYL